MSDPAPRRPLADRPLWFATLSLLLGAAATGLLTLWASLDPVTVIVGKEGHHDLAQEATCLDCHVPFEGTPSSRCLAPGCHGDLATGTPPRDGPAMPVRFHVALRSRACVECHAEHVEDVIRRFDHNLIPDEDRSRCRDCHLGQAVASHARTDAIGCELCHALTEWGGAQMQHGRVGQQACDLCHRRPETPAHASVAGACADCHRVEDWQPKPEDDQDAAK